MLTTLCTVCVCFFFVVFLDFCDSSVVNEGETLVFLIIIYMNRPFFVAPFQK